MSCCALSLLLLGGCASYTVPGGPGQVATLGATRDDQTVHADPNLRQYYEAKPLAEFPVMIATARVQSADYESRTATPWGGGPSSNYSVITTRDVESDVAFARLGRLPMIRAIAPINRLLLPPQLSTDESLRMAAARVKADILIIYTFDTKFYVKDFAAPVTVFTLGLSPNKRAYVTTTATAILQDVRSGYVYGGAEATSQSQQLSNGWTSSDAVDDTRLRTEKESFEKLVGELEREWGNVLNAYAGPTTRKSVQN